MSDADLINGQLRYYLHIQNPEELEDEQWVKQFAVLTKIREMEKGSQSPEE